MNETATLWIGLAAGAVVGTAGTWITIGVAIALGRYLARRGQLVAYEIPLEPPADTFDNNFRDLIAQQKQQP